jgi:hypothetical protein
MSSFASFLAVESGEQGRDVAVVAPGHHSRPGGELGEPFRRVAGVGVPVALGARQVMGPTGWPPGA